ERLLHTFHRAGVNGVKLLVLKMSCKCLRLLVSTRGKIHVDAPAEDAMVTLLHLCVAQQKETRGGDHFQLTARASPAVPQAIRECPPCQAPATQPAGSR